VFNKFAKMVGGSLRLSLSGGGPLNPEVQRFTRTCFGCPLIQGYGLTETCAGLSIQAPDDTRTGIAGVPLACCRVKLVNCPDIKDKNGALYCSTDNKDADGHAILGRGEILVEGNNVSLGYYMMPEKTAEEYAGGFFHTGDIGQFMPDGSLRIVDRKKNLLKLKGGEYIAIEHMEATYGNSSFVDPIAGGICCYGDGEMDRPVALIQLNRAHVSEWAKHHGFTFDQARESKELMETVKADLEMEAKKGGLSNLERLAGVALLTTPWTPENGCLTAANKLDRRSIFEVFNKTEFRTVCKQGISR
jgi:long-chain acyl-CoA synthetase